MEIADLFVVNKADRPGAEKLRQEIEVTLGHPAGQRLPARAGAHGVRRRRAARRRRSDGARPPASGPPDAGSSPSCSTVAAKGEGIAELVAALDRHHAWLAAAATLGAAPPAAAAGADPRGGGPGHRAAGSGRRPAPSSAIARAARRGRGGAGEPVRAWRRKCSTASSRERAYDDSAPNTTPSSRQRWPSRSASSSGSAPRWPPGGRGRGELPVRDDTDFTSVSGRAVEPVYTPLDLAPDLAGAAGLPGRVPVHPRHPPHDVPRPALDDAPVRRLRHRRGHQRALQVPARARADRALGRVRLPDADGLRLRPPALRGRGRASAASRSRSLADMETLFDGIPLDQVSTSMTINGPAAILFCFYVAAAEKQGVPHRQAPGHDPERHPQGVHGAARLDLPGGARAQDHRGPVRVGRRAHARSGTRSRSPATTSARPAPPRRRSWRSRWPTASATWSTAWRAGSTSTASRRGSRSSGTSTTTSSRRSPSCAPPAGSGPGTCASATARGTRAAG